MIISHPKSKFFYKSYQTNDISSDANKQTLYLRNSSEKIDQSEYCSNQIKSIINSCQNESEGNLVIDAESLIKLKTYIEGLLIFGKSSLDCAVAGYFYHLKGEFKYDSITKFLNKIDKEEKFLGAKEYEFWQNIKSLTEVNNLNWTKSIFRLKNKSLRDLIVHSKSIELDVIYGNKNPTFHINPNFKNKLSIPYSVTIKHFDEIIDGIKSVLTHIRTELYK